jgi:hydrogenase 3 maturation protease
MGKASVAGNPFIPILRGKTMLVGIGNELRGDDAVGLVVARRLRGAVGARVLETGDAPENHLGLVVLERPDTVLLIDAADLGRPPGEFEILDPADMEGTCLTTHAMPLAELSGVISFRTGAAVHLLGIQPASVRIGSPLSRPLRRTAVVLADLIAAALLNNAPGNVCSAEAEPAVEKGR